MRHLLFACGGLVLLFNSCALSTAGLTIPANQTFILGEYRKAGYGATLTNEGKQAVDVRLVRQADGSVAATLRLPAGERKSVRVAGGQEVHLINASEGDARLRVRSAVKGRQGMRYRDNAADPPLSPSRPGSPD